MNLLFAGNYNLEERKRDELNELGIDLIIMPDEKAELPISPDSVDMVVCNWLFVNKNICDFNNLKYIQLLSSGIDRVPTEYTDNHNIIVNNAKGVYSIPMAEYAVLGVLELAKKSKVFFENQKKQRWEKIRNLDELSNKTVSILGIGSVGREVAKKFSCFCKKIIGVDIVNTTSDYIDEYFHINDLDKAVEESDIIVVALPLTDSTKHLINKSSIEKMDKTPIIVNISRGQIIKEDDLVDALKNGRIQGAVLDVFENEPLSKDSELWMMKNVIITPHNSFESKLNEERMWKLIIDNIKEYLNNG